MARLRPLRRAPFSRQSATRPTRASPPVITIVGRLRRPFRLRSITTTTTTNNTPAIRAGRNRWRLQPLAVPLRSRNCHPCSSRFRRTTAVTIIRTRTTRRRPHRWQPQPQRWSRQQPPPPPPLPPPPASWPYSRTIRIFHLRCV